MSHRLFIHSTFSNARAWAFLKQIDEAEAARCREAGCSQCGGDLHSATYPRKPYGLAAELREDARRYSFCCGRCRARATPASVRFFGRRFYVAALFLMVSALALSGGVRLETIGRKWRIPLRTLRRWREWWREALPRTGPWRRKRGELAMASEQEPLVFLLRHMRGASFRERLWRTLIWFMPWTGYCAFGDGPALPAESVSIADG